MGLHTATTSSSSSSCWFEILIGLNQVEHQQIEVSEIALRGYAVLGLELCATLGLWERVM